MERTGDYLVRTVIVLAVFLALSAISYGQGLTAVTGRVTDPTGAVIPGVTVSVTNVATGVSREVISNEQGIYAATQLQPGTYSVKAELAGFKPNVASAVVLPVDQTVTLNFPMSVANTSEVVTVESSAEVVNTENAQLGNNFTSKEIIDLPLNARNIVGLLSLQAGVSANPVDANGNTTSTTTSGFVNGARNDQQNIVLDGVDNNQFQAGGAFTGVLPTTLDSVQEFIVQTSGQSAASSRSSGAQVQLVTKSGSNNFHGSLYESYRSKLTTATPYFNGQATPKPGLIRNIPGGSVGGPIIKNKLFFFGAFERHTDRSQTSVSRTVPTTQYLNGIFRYQRTASAAKADGQSYGTLSQGCGGQLGQITGIACDTLNPALFGPQGYMQQYADYVNNPGKFAGHLVCPADCSNFQNFTFNAPNIVNQNVYISRWDYTINSKNTVYVRGTLNNSATIGAPTFPDRNNGLTTYDNSKGFSASLNSVLSPTWNNNFTVGLTRQSGNTTGAAAVVYSFGPSNPNQTTGANRSAINTWNFVDNLSWIKGTHSWSAGVNFNLVNNNVKSYSQVSPGNFSSAANYTTGDFATTCSLTCGPALGADYANVNNYSTFENNILQGIGALNLFTVGLQWDKNGNLLPTGTPFARIIRMDQYDFYVQDSWKMKPNFTFNYGLHWGLMTAPWEKNGNQVNWVYNLGQRYRMQQLTPLTSDQLPTLTTQLAGRANNLPDYYPPALNNFAPRASFAYSPKFADGFLGTLTNKGGPMVIRAGYALSFDHTGGNLAYSAATSAGIGLFTSQQFGASQYSINGNAQPAVPRVGGTGSALVLPYNAFPVSGTQNFSLAASTGGWGSAGSVPAIDSGLRPPQNHLLNFTLSKELPGGFILEASYVGRYARDLMGQVDLANPVNIYDKASGQSYYDAMAQIMGYLANGVGGYQTITTANAAAAVASIPKMPFFDNPGSPYAGFQQWAQTGTVNGVAGKDTANAFPGVTFQNGAQAFYAALVKGLKPGPNTPVILTNVTEAYELDTNQHITTNGQTQSMFLNTNIGKSNYNSAQFSVRKRFAQGYGFMMNYTWSRSMDFTSASEAFGTRPGGSGSVDQILDPYHPEKNYAPSTFDRKGQFNGNFTAELPFGTGKLIGSGMGNLFNQIFGGWSVSGIWNAATGTPYTYQAQLRYSLHYNGLDKPIPLQQLPTNLVHSPNANYTVPMVFWLGKEQGANCDAVCAQEQRLAAVNADPSKGTIYFTNVYPNSAVARNYVRGPGFWNADASVLKTFRINEKVSGRFSADAFNVFNHPSFANPSGTGVNIDSTSGLLGQITSLQGANRVMQFNLRFAF
jgi:hypothetical protein